jgi:hypothetical protein
LMLWARMWCCTAFAWDDGRVGQSVAYRRMGGGGVGGWCGEAAGVFAAVHACCKHCSTVPAVTLAWWAGHSPPRRSLVPSF